MRASGYGSGWHGESLRHSRARRLGVAGGKYSGRFATQSREVGKRRFEQLTAEGIMKNPKHPQLVAVQNPSGRGSFIYSFKTAKQKNAFIKEMSRKYPETNIVHT